MTTRPRKTATSKKQAITPRQECAVRIASSILAGPTGGRILSSKDPEAIAKLARLTVKLADAILAEAA